MRAIMAAAVLLLLGSATLPAQRVHLLVVTGLSGEPKYGAAFAGAARRLADSARARWALGDSSVIVLGDTTVAEARAQRASTRANIAEAFATLARRVAPDDVVLVFLNGHGSGEGAASRVGLPGPDATAADFNGWLQPFARQTVVFVNAASGSGDFGAVLRGPRRVVVTATRSAMERNESVFAPHFVAALTGSDADADKDGGVTVQEAFALATKEVVRAYESANKLRTEHAVMSDTTLATMVRFGPPGRVAASPEAAALARRRQGMYADVAALRARKAELPAAAYESELEALLVRIAETSRAIRAASEGGRR